MSKIFVEYQILPQHRPAYSEWMMKVRAQSPSLELYEGSDQPGLFVEMWEAASVEEYLDMRTVRLQTETETDRESSSSFPWIWVAVDWSPLAEWIQGGKAKIHIWHFVKVK